LKYTTDTEYVGEYVGEYIGENLDNLKEDFPEFYV